MPACPHLVVRPDVPLDKPVRHLAWFSVVVVYHGSPSMTPPAHGKLGNWT